jgi:hypothetical protein
MVAEGNLERTTKQGIAVAVYNGASLLSGRIIY